MDKIIERLRQADEDLTRLGQKWDQMETLEQEFADQLMNEEANYCVSMVYDLLILAAGAGLLKHEPALTAPEPQEPPC